jgi:hypothetical protein
MWSQHFGECVECLGNEDRVEAVADEAEGVDRKSISKEQSRSTEQVEKPSASLATAQAQATSTTLPSEEQEVDRQAVVTADMSVQADPVELAADPVEEAAASSSSSQQPDNDEMPRGSSVRKGASAIHDIEEMIEKSRAYGSTVGNAMSGRAVSGGSPVPNSTSTPINFNAKAAAEVKQPAKVNESRAGLAKEAANAKGQASLTLKRKLAHAAAFDGSDTEALKELNQMIGRATGAFLTAAYDGSR